MGDWQNILLGALWEASGRGKVSLTVSPLPSPCPGVLLLLLQRFSRSRNGERIIDLVIPLLLRDALVVYYLFSLPKKISNSTVFLVVYRITTSYPAELDLEKETLEGNMPPPPPPPPPPQDFKEEPQAKHEEKVHVLSYVQWKKRDKVFANLVFVCVFSPSILPL